MGIIYSLCVGAIAGWLAGKLMKGGGFGIIINIIIGVIGGFVGRWLFDILNINAINGTIGQILTSTIGAVVILVIAGLLNKK